MDRFFLGIYFWTIAILISISCPLHGSTIDVSESVRNLVEADWIKADIEFDPECRFSPAHTKQLIIRGCKLAERLRGLSAPESRLEPLVTKLRRFESRLTDSVLTADDRQEIYLNVRWTIRKIAFCNPLLDFDKILFIKRHDSVGVFHMCDQYYGCNAKPGGGLFILNDPFGENPGIINVLENAVVEHGRFKGDNLTTGAFLSPELSYDGKKILFAYTWLGHPIRTGQSL